MADPNRFRFDARDFYLKFGFTEIDYGVVFRKESTL